MKKIMYIGCGIVIMYLLSACSTADTNGSTKEIDTNTSITISNNKYVYFSVPLSTTSAYSGTQETANSPATNVAPNTSLGLNGSTSSLADEGAKLAVEAVSTGLQAIKDGNLPVTETPEVVDPEAPEAPTDPVTEKTTEVLDYRGKTNGDRDTWYGENKFSEYGSPMHVTIAGCFDADIEHDGVRYEANGLLIKQSDVSGRGMAMLYSSTCSSESATVEY